jgi:integrase
MMVKFFMNPDYSQTERTNSEVRMQGELTERINMLIPGSAPYFHSILLKMASANAQNVELLCKFVAFECNQSNIKLSTRLTHIKVICWFDRYEGHRDFSTLTRDDVVAYFMSLRKGEIQDPTHRWIGTYNTRQIILCKFFRWLHNQNQADYKKWITPPCLQAIRPLPRREKSPYKPSDIWTNEEHAIFLKYCPEKRDRCYHAMANDTSARPHELLALKIKDIVFRIASTGLQYAEVHITQTKTRPRTVPLIFSVPYIKDWIDSHPMGANLDAFLFISLADSNFGQQLGENALYKLYTRTYKNRYFRKLLENPMISEGERSYIRNMLTKPWCPYILRHSALTSKSQILKESTLREHAGWSMTSRMPSMYIHYFGNESSKSLLEAYGIENYNQKQINVLKSKTCPGCCESCKPDAKFCAKCRMVLTYDAYNETLEEQKKKEDKLTVMEERFNDMQLQIQSLIVTLSGLKDQNQLDQTARMLYKSGILSSATSAVGDST